MVGDPAELAETVLMFLGAAMVRSASSAKMATAAVVVEVSCILRVALDRTTV